MRTLMIAATFLLLGPSQLMAQSQGTLDKAGADPRSCLLMSDSMSTALMLSDDQRKLVRQSDERCLQACERAGYLTAGKMDDAAMRNHEDEMGEILNTVQFERWSAMCGSTKVHKNTAAPGME